MTIDDGYRLIWEKAEMESPGTLALMELVSPGILANLHLDQLTRAEVCYDAEGRITKVTRIDPLTNNNNK